MTEEMEQAQEEYVYDRLSQDDEASKPIRLLHLFPGQEDSLLEGALSTVSLSTNPHYEALSYVWGNPADPKKLVISGRCFSMTWNLASALRSLRHEQEPRILWVDALCINQADLDERSQQVSIMASIYQQAHRVLVYVGERTEDSDLALDVTEKLGGVTSTPDNKPRQDDEFNELLEDARRLGSLQSEEWDALRHFFLERAYFTRSWVIQEIAQAREALLFCGKRSMPWKTVENIQEGYERIWGWMSNTVRQLNVVFAVAWSMNKKLKLATPTIHYAHPPRLDHYLSRFSSNRCSDRHDYIYAYLGLISFAKGRIRPNYKKSSSEVFVEATRAMIAESRDLLAVCLTRRCGRPLEETTMDLPSWVTDWSFPLACDQLVSGDEDEQIFYANGRAKVNDRTIPRLTGPEDNILHIDGAVVDSIQSLCPGISIGHRNWEDKTRNWVPRDLDRRAYLHIDGKRHEAIDIFWKTILKYHPFCSYKDGRPGRRWHVDHYRYLFMKWAGLQLTDSDIEKAEKSVKLRKGDDEQADWIERDFTQCIEGFLHGWTLCTTSKGMWAMVPFDSREGDTIVVARGSCVPLLLRPAGGEFYQLVGTAYMYGIMQKQIMDMIERGEMLERGFALC